MPNSFGEASGTALTTEYQEFDLGYGMRFLRVFNEEPSGGKVIYVSWDGVNPHEKIMPGQAANFDEKFFDNFDVNGVAGLPKKFWLKSAAAGAAYNYSANG